jgi:hypothetical protein
MSGRLAQFSPLRPGSPRTSTSHLFLFEICREFLSVPAHYGVEERCEQDEKREKAASSAELFPAEGTPPTPPLFIFKTLQVIKE